MSPPGRSGHSASSLETLASRSGQADSAPANFRPGRIALRATILAAVLFALYYANYVNGWIEVGDLNLFGEPPEIEGLDAY